MFAWGVHVEVTGELDVQMARQVFELVSINGGHWHGLGTEHRMQWVLYRIGLLQPSWLEYPYIS